MPNMQPADELFDLNPDPRLERFFLFVMLEHGHPGAKMWLETTAPKIYKMYREWLVEETREEGPVLDRYPDAPTAMLQYCIWYEREGSRLDANRN